MGPAPIVIVAVVVVVCCLVRLLGSVWMPAPGRLSTAVQLVMGSAMAGMVAPALRVPLPGLIWISAFGVASAGFLLAWVWSRIRARPGAVLSVDHRSHSLSAGAMAFMVLPAEAQAPPSLRVIVATVLTALLVHAAARNAHGALVAARELLARRPRPTAGDVLMAMVWPRCFEAVTSVVMATMVYSIG